jgi:gliding motility-associated-like protein
MKFKFTFLLTSTFLFSISLFAQSTGGWKANSSDSKAFIENKGQMTVKTSEKFNNDVKYYYNGTNEKFHFTPSGVALEYTDTEHRVKSDEEKEARKARKAQGFKSKAEFDEFEKEGQRRIVKHDILEMNWIGSNENAEIIAEEKNSFYHNIQYYGENKEIKYLYNVSSYNKITYKNLYPNIDVVYEIYALGGLKYSLILHPGADISKVKLEYSRNSTLNADGTIHTATKLGDIIDHAPLTFYKKNTKSIIDSKYVLNGNTISFSLGDYNTNQTIIIDPWIQSPTFATAWDCVWECERDGAGNVYIIAGIDNMELKKYNSTGTLQWTHVTPYDTSLWLGTFATDNAGNSYVTAGSVAQIQKINTAGAVVWNNTNPGGIFTSTEFWNISFNCDQTLLVIGGTGGFLPPLPYIYNVDMNSGNVLSDVQVTGGELFPTQEVRSITACGNGKYYYLTHDSLGYIHQSLTSCSTSGNTTPTLFPHNYALSYKAENYRYDNSGIMALKYYGGFIFAHRGNQLHKIDFNSGTVLQTVAIPGGGFNATFGRNQVTCSGIDIDDCGNIFVGSSNGVYKFTQALVANGSFATTFNVYDVTVNTNGEVIAAGATGNSGNVNTARTGSVQTFAAAACTPQATVCCDATVCAPPMFCPTDGPTAINAINSGGTWSASCGSCINATTGVFSPSVAGIGAFTITYTISCGSETVDVYVNNCTPLSVCLESNGTMTVSGGTGPYDWSEFLPATTIPITTEQECVTCNSNYAWIPFFNSCRDGLFLVSNCNTAAGYEYLSTGANATPGTNFPIIVEDFGGQTFIINSTASLPACTTCPTLTITPANQINVNCFGQSTGSFNVTTAGGTGPYDYVLLLGSTTISTFNNVPGSQAFTGLAAGTYTLNVTDNGGCTGTTTVIITSNPALTLTQSSLTPASCGSNNGSVTVSGGGGSGTITYSWNTSPVQTGATASGLAAGPYIVTATDALGCSTTLNVTMTSTGGISASITNPVNPLCNNGTNGTATASVTGGSGTITYSWSPSGGSAATGTGLSGGILYTVTVTDANSCSATATVTLTNPTAISVTTSSTDANCGASDGTLSANGSGGTGTLDYSWNTTPVQNTANATGVPSGNYILTVTDDNGCTATANESINNVGAPTISIVSQVDLDCNGDTDGTATVSGSGGNGTLTYSWNTVPVQTGVTATNLAGGSYIATVTDASGCSSTVTITIAEPAAITGVATSTASACSSNTGTATVVASGGDGNYTYLWSNNGTTSTISNLAPSTYNVTITDGNGCTGTTSTTVSTVTAANIDAGADVVIVSGTSTTLVATGGIVYTWTPSDSLSCTNCANPTANPSQTTTYYVTGTDANGCVGTDSVRVFVEDPCGELWVPTAFSPNGDGNNELLCVYGGCILNLTFQMFDRWGEMVFETTDNSLCWDGVYKGKQMNSAVFAYYLIATLDNGEVVELKGNITLVR